MFKQTIPAFTIMEVTISMLVAAIVVAMTYSAYAIITRSWLGFTGKNRQMAVILRLDELLRRDFEKASFVKQEQGGIIIQGGEQPVHYQIGPEQVVRTGSITDTFEVTASPLKVYFEGMAVSGTVEDSGQTASETAGTGAESNIKACIDEVAFSVSLQNTVIPFHYKKKYSAESLMAIKP